MRKLSVLLASAALLAAPTMAGKIACRNAKGQAAKCPPSGTTIAAAGGQVSAPDKVGHCHVVVPDPSKPGQKKGQIASCPKG